MAHHVDLYVGRRLKQLRKLRGFSQAEVARELNISFQQIQKYEIGTNRVSASRLYELGQILKVPASYFFVGLQSEGAKALSMEADQKVFDALAAIKDEKVQLLILDYIEALKDEGEIRH